MTTYDGARSDKRKQRVESETQSAGCIPLARPESPQATCGDSGTGSTKEPRDDQGDGVGPPPLPREVQGSNLPQGFELTEGEQLDLSVYGGRSGNYSCACDGDCPVLPCDNDRSDLFTVVARLVADRLRAVEAERDRMAEGLRTIAAEHEKQTAYWHHRDHPSESASRWHDGYISACASHAIAAKKYLDPEGAADDDRRWRIGANGSDVEWYRETGHCGHCGVVAAGCECAGECGCSDAHGPRKEAWVSPLERAEIAEATLTRVQKLPDDWERLAAGNEAARGKSTRVAGYYRRNAAQLRKAIGGDDA